MDEHGPFPWETTSTKFDFVIKHGDYMGHIVGIEEVGFKNKQ